MTIAETDILIVGAGVAGFAAAMSARASGASVLMVEKATQLGGNAIMSNVGTICGAYYRADNSKVLTPIDHPFLKEFLQRLNVEPVLAASDLPVVPYQVEVLHGIIRNQLTQSGVQVLYDAALQHVTWSDEHIDHVIIQVRGETQKVKARSYIDCSGNGVITQLAGLDMIQSSSYQRASQVFRVQGVSSENEYALNFAIKKELIKSGKKLGKLNASIIPGSIRENGLDIKFTLPTEITDATDQQELNELGESLTYSVMTILTRGIESFKKAQITKVYPNAGIRIQQRSKGRYMLLEEDVIGCRRFDDSRKVIGAWPIEEWNANGRVKLTPLGQPGFYEIPLDCLKSASLKNLYFAGKNISATDRAVASARVIGTCLQTGFEAGRLASGYLKV